MDGVDVRESLKFELLDETAAGEGREFQVVTRFLYRVPLRCAAVALRIRRITRWCGAVGVVDPVLGLFWGEPFEEQLIKETLSGERGRLQVFSTFLRRLLVLVYVEDVRSVHSVGIGESLELELGYETAAGEGHKLQIVLCLLACILLRDAFSRELRNTLSRSVACRRRVDRNVHLNIRHARGKSFDRCGTRHCATGGSGHREEDSHERNARRVHPSVHAASRLRKSGYACGRSMRSCATAQLTKVQPCCSMTSSISDHSETDPDSFRCVIGVFSIGMKNMRPSSAALRASAATFSILWSLSLIQPIKLIVRAGRPCASSSRVGSVQWL